nr:ATPase, F1 complex alpha/beta subunit, N-terminal domain-containing protein [Tanacetum cinerariifolium]
MAHDFRVCYHPRHSSSKLFLQEERHPLNYLLEWGHNTEIDYLLVRKGDLRACKDCKAFPSKACSSQHRLVTLDILFERQRQRRAETGRLRILWKNLNGDAVETFRVTISKKLSTLGEDMAANVDVDNFKRCYTSYTFDVGYKGCWFGGKLIQKLLQKGVYKESFLRHAAWIEEKLIQLMHTTMVPEQVKTPDIQARVQVSRPEDTYDIFSIGSALEDVYFVVFVLGRNISLELFEDEDFLLVDGVLDGALGAFGDI